MKKLNTRTVLFIALILTSLGSSIYLNTVEVDPSSEVTVETEKTGELEDQAQKIILPDVQLIKKLLNTGKAFLPES